MNTEELKTFLTEQGYYNLREIPGRGMCGLMDFIFTVGLCEGLTEDTFSGRYCYPKELIKESIIAIELWDGKEDPIGEWIKYKGSKGERNRAVTKYVRLLSYDNACKVQDFVNNMDNEDHAHITVGGLAITSGDFVHVKGFIMGLDVPYDLTEEHPTKVEEQIVDKLKEDGVI